MPEAEPQALNQTVESKSTPSSASKSKTAAWDPLARLLWDYEQGREDALAEVIMEDGGRHDMPAEVFFQSEEEFGDAELLALDLCRGPVLDIGAGAGRHSLALQERGVETTALEIEPRLEELMRTRGVRRTLCADVVDSSWQGGRSWETLLMLMNGIGLVGDLAGLDRFLLRARNLTRPEGLVIVDSCDLGRLEDPAETWRIIARSRQGLYYGETRQVIEYRGERGKMLPWLYVDPEILQTHAARAGWSAQVVFEGGDGSFLAVLRLLS